MASIYLRGKTWWIRYRHNRKTIRLSLDTRLEKKALRAKAALEDELEREVHRPERRVTFETFLRKYEKSYVAAGGKDLRQSRERSWKKDSHSLRRFKAYCETRGVTRLHKVSPQLIEDFREARLEDGVEDSTRNKDIRILKCGWNWAKRKGLVRTNPFKKVKLFKIPEREIDTLSPEEVVKLLAHVKSRSMYPLVATAVYAGLRLSELLTLEWTKNVDLKRGWIHVVNKGDFLTKSRHSRQIPIAPELDGILRPFAKSEGRCFLTRLGKPFAQNVGQRLTWIAKRDLKLYVTPHVLRKTFGTILLARDVPIETISKWLGHSSIAVTQSWYARHTLDAGRHHILALSFSPVRKVLKVRPKS